MYINVTIKTRIEQNMHKMVNVKAYYLFLFFDIPN